jgi:hypothetical protein
MLERQIHTPLSYPLQSGPPRAKSKVAAYHNSLSNMGVVQDAFPQARQAAALRNLWSDTAKRSENQRKAGETAESRGSHAATASRPRSFRFVPLLGCNAVRSGTSG